MEARRPPRPLPRKPEGLRKLSNENLLIIERHLLGEIPEKLRPRAQAHPRPTDLAIAKPTTSLLSACLQIPDSPNSPNYSPTDSERSGSGSGSPLKKSFSFREKLSRISFLGKHKDKPKIKAIAEDEPEKTELVEEETDKNPHYGSKGIQEQRASKRFLFFKQKEIERRERSLFSLNKRSKSFEFLPRAIEEETEMPTYSTLQHNKLHCSQSFGFGSEAHLADPQCGEHTPPSYKFHDVDEDVFAMHSIKESESETSSKEHGSSVSTMASTNSSGGIHILQRGSVQNILDEFDKTVELFNENYTSDCEPYTQTPSELNKKEKRKSLSFSTLPSPKVVQFNPFKPVVSEEFKQELSVAISARRASECEMEGPRRGSVTDWFVLEERKDDNYRRALRKPTNRVRRVSSTKYWITPEECAVYSREQRPPLVIPRITQYRGQRERLPPPVAHSYPEETFQEPQKASSVRQYDRLPEWSPDRYDVDYKTSESPRAIRMLARNRLAGSTENLLMRRPNQLQLPTSSSGDSLDIEVREKDSAQARSRKSKSMVAPKHRVRSPVPAPRMLVPAPPVESGTFQASVVQEGFVKRTKFSESGKKCKKNWTECYMLLTQTGLVFFKDQKTYYATKVPRPAGSPPSPAAPRAELVLPLRNAHVVPCIQMHTRRHSRSLVLTVGYDQYLLQDETEDGAKRWLTRIQNIIYKLGPPLLDDYPTPQSQSSNTDIESIGRTPPPAPRHPHRSKQKAGGSSNEDLSDEKTHVKSRLKKFFARRPTMEVLVKKGIYKDEPVFGRNLEEVCPVTSTPRVPEFVVHCVEEIEGSEENMCTDGLYRASGNLSQVQKIRLEIDQNNLSVIKNNPDIHVLTGSLKLFFRELKEPLIPFSVFDRVLSACSIKPREARTKEFRDIVQSLPQCNRDTLKFLLEHLLRVTQYSERNRMHTANLAIVFGPTLLWAPAEQAHNIAIDCIQQNNVVDILLTDFKEIFAEESKIKKKS